LLTPEKNKKAKVKLEEEKKRTKNKNNFSNYRQLIMLLLTMLRSAGRRSASYHVPNHATPKLISAAAMVAVRGSE